MGVQRVHQVRGRHTARRFADPIAITVVDGTHGTDSAGRMQDRPFAVSSQAEAQRIEQRVFTLADFLDPCIEGLPTLNPKTPAFAEVADHRLALITL